MTYTVKNGTWCKDNQGEYLSTTLTGLKAMRKAGQVPEGTRVVVHEPRQSAGTLIQSLNPNPPEGFFVPDGSAFDTEVYTDLAVIFPDGNLPDLREYVLVCAGQNSANIRHDVFAAGEAKQDQAQLVEHTHSVTDPGHAHNITDPGHAHNTTDPGHAHNITDPGHAHGPGTFEITGSFAEDSNTATNGAFYRTNSAGERSASGDGGAVWIEFNASRSWTGKTEVVETNINVNSAETGVSVNSAETGVSVNSAETGITISSTGNNDVTRTKQFGVYYYIAF